MTQKIPIVLIFTFTAGITRAAPALPPGTGQILEPIEFFADPSPPAKQTARQFAGQKTTTAKLVLTASNGFFDPGLRAAGEAPVHDSAGPTFIGPDYAYLHNWKQPGTTLRWHFWAEKTGPLFANTHLVTKAGDAGSRLDYQLADAHQTLSTRAESNPDRPQGSPLAFNIPHPGWHTLVIRLHSLAGTEVGQLHHIELFGPAITDARLLRTRWRPAACHARFSSSTVEKPMLWVMTTRMSPTSKVSSYSPITTPFGYFGTGFGADGYSSPTANFSLWSFGKGKPKPQQEWSHLLAVGSPDAEFGSFGHEGSGVKVRGDWKPLGTETREVTLALRGEPVGPWIHWFGYYLDPQSQRFRLYAAAADWNGKRKMRSLNPGAFVEQPGPPNRRRCGDIIRDIHRRGWVLDDAKNWHPINTMSTGKGLAAKHWGQTPQAWFSMGMGGMVYHEGTGKPVQIPENTKPSLPKWLQGDALKDLFKLPAQIGNRTTTGITRNSARIEVDLTGLDLDPGERATVTVFHGPEDCQTFTKDLGYKETQTRFWAAHSEAIPVREGKNSFELTDLPPDAAHHFRLLLESPRGRIWSFESDSFRTLP